MYLIARVERVAARLRAWLLRFRGITVGCGCQVGRSTVVRRTWLNKGYGLIVLGEYCELRDGALLESWGGVIRLGRSVFIGPQVVIYGHGGVEIGDNSLVAMHCSIVSSNHTAPPWGIEIRSQPDMLLATRIGRDVWLGAGVTVLGGVTIGDGCIVGAGAVVTKDLPPGAIAMGIPAEIRAFREGSSTPGH